MKAMKGKERGESENMRKAQCDADGGVDAHSM